MAMLAMTEWVGWGSLRIDKENGKMISTLHQVTIVDIMCSNARDDRMGGWGLVRIDNLIGKWISNLHQEMTF
ncbi:MAG: hypothetical protein ACYDH2_03010 [Anaerolineaceae bacterium]